VKDLRGTMAPSDPTPLQVSAWRRLWAIPLAPDDSIAATPENSDAASAATEPASSDEHTRYST
jgi:hypothetical protein